MDQDESIDLDLETEYLEYAQDMENLEDAPEEYYVVDIHIDVFSFNAVLETKSYEEQLSLFEYFRLANDGLTILVGAIK